MSKIKSCVICHATFTGHGHNAMPVAEGRCCDECNDITVLVARMKLFIDRVKAEFGRPTRPPKEFK